MLLLYIWQIYSCYFLHMTFGTLAFFFSPLRTWLTLLTPVLIHCVWTRNSDKLGTFTVQLKSHLSSWKPCLTIHLCRPLPQQQVESQYWWARFGELLLLGCLGVGEITHYWFLQNGVQESLQIMPWFLPSSRKQRIDLLLWRESLYLDLQEGLDVYGRICGPVFLGLPHVKYLAQYLVVKGATLGKENQCELEPDLDYPWAIIIAPSLFFLLP